MLCPCITQPSGLVLLRRCNCFVVYVELCIIRVIIKKEEPELSIGLVVLAGLYRNEKPTSQKTDVRFGASVKIFF